MRKKVWLARGEDGLYDLFLTKPYNMGGEWFVRDVEKEQLSIHLCPTLVKQWFDLKKHLRIKTCIRGTFNVSFVPDKKKVRIGK